MLKRIDLADILIILGCALMGCGLFLLKNVGILLAIIGVVALNIGILRSTIGKKGK